MGNAARSLKGFDPNRIPKGYYIFSGIGTAFGVTVLTKDYFGGKKYDEKYEQTCYGKTVVITGANTGIGKETARGLAKRGAKIIMACRDLKKCEIARQEILQEAVFPNVDCMELNLASCESIRKFAEKIKQEKREVDVLINNAGVMGCLKMQTEEGFEYQLGVNYLGHFLLTNLLLDKLKGSENGRIINLVSPTFKKAVIHFEDLNSTEEYNPKFAYGQSKLALVLFTQELARRLKGTRVTVNAVNPGVAKTGIGRHTPMGRDIISRNLLSPVFWLFLKSPYQGSQTSIFMAIDPSVEKVTGKYYADLAEESLPPECCDETDAQRLWLISEKWTKLDTDAQHNKEV